MSLLLTPLSSFAFAVSAICLLLIRLIWQKRFETGAQSLLGLACTVFIWLVGAGFEVAAVTPADQIWFAKFEYLGIASLPVFWLLYVLDIGGYPKFLPKKATLLIWLFPVISIILVLTNELHGLVWPSIETNGQDLVFQHGIAFWIMFAYSYVLIIWGMVRLIFLLRFPSQVNPKLTWLILGGAIFPVIAHVVYLSGIFTAPGLDPTTLAFSLSLILYTWGFLRLGILELQPMALNTVVESLGDAVLVFDKQDRLIYANQMALTLVGIEKPNKQPAAQIFSKQPLVLQHINSSTSRETEIYLPINNVSHSFDLRSQELFAANKSPMGRLIILHDSTDRLEVNERFRNLLEAAPDAILVINEECQIDMVNERACNLLERERGEIYHQHVVDLIAPDDKGTFELNELIRSTLETKQPSQGISLMRQSKEGNKVHLELSASPYLTYDRQLVIITARDVTERNAVEEQLRLQSVALTSAANGILIADKTGRIVWVNPAFSHMTGYTAEEAIGRMSNLLRSGEHDRDFYDKLWQTILTGQTWKGETTNRRKDGSIYVEEQTIAPVIDPDGSVNFFVAIKNDITERKQLEQMRDNLLHTMVHDLRNPLNSIISSLDMAMTEAPAKTNPAAHDEFLSLAQISAQRMENLVNSILDLNKLESGSMPINRERLFLARLVDQLIMTQAPLASPKNIHILNQVPTDTLPVWADGSLVSRVLQNLVDNAIKFGPENSNILIFAITDDRKQFIVTSVRDFGSGIPITLRSRLFQKFATGGGRGTGIGLAFCRLAIEAHGGRIWVDSTPQQGTTFHFSLPIAHTGALSPNIDAIRD